jgi:hypothetical protein
VSRSSAEPFDELRRNAVFDDRDSQDAVSALAFFARLCSMRLPELFVLH